MYVLYASATEDITISQLSQRAGDLIVGSSGSKDLQLIPRIACILTILKRAFVAQVHGADAPAEVSLGTLKEAEGIVTTSTKQKQLYLEVSLFKSIKLSPKIYEIILFGMQSSAILV